MPPRSRRALLQLLGSGTVGLVAGCETGPATGTPTKRSTTTDRSTTTASPSDTATATGTESPSKTPAELRCSTVERPDAAWPVPRRSPGRDGYVADPQRFEAAPEVAWVAEPSVPEDTSATPSYGVAVVAHGRVYLMNHLRTGPMRTDHGSLHAIDAESGDRVWASERFRYPSPPVVWGELVVIHAQTESLGTKVVAFDRGVGTRRWTREFAAGDDGFTRAADQLYLALEEGSGRGTIRALANDGSTTWSREGAFADHVTEGPVVGPDHVYVGTRGGRVHALSRADGTSVWSHSFEEPGERRLYVTDIVVTECAVVVRLEDSVRALDDEGSVVWTVHGDYSRLATDGETIYGVVDLGGGQHEVRAHSAATGDVDWTVATTGGGLPMVAGDAVYVSLGDGVAALAAADGTERWRTDGSMGALARTDGTLYGLSNSALVARR